MVLVPSPVMWHHLLQEYKTPLHPHWDERRARGSTQLQPCSQQVREAGAALDGYNGPSRNDLLGYLFGHSLTGGFHRFGGGEGSQSVAFILCRAVADYSSRSTCCIFNSVGDTGLEPATSRMSTVCSNQTELTARCEGNYTHLADLVNW